MAVASIRLDISRVGAQMIYKVTSLDNGANELDHVGWIVARVANENPLAMEEAHDLASEWCRTYGFKTYMMYDHRVHPNDYIANAAAQLDPRTSERSIQLPVRDRADTPSKVASDNAPSELISQHLRLNYARDDEPNRTGFVRLSVSSGGFSATTEAYVSEEQLLRFAMKLKSFPLDESGAKLEAPEVEVTIRPLDPRGHLLVIADLRSPWGDGRSTQEATLRFRTDYATVDRFARATVAMVRSGLGDAHLE